MNLRGKNVAEYNTRSLRARPEIAWRVAADVHAAVYSEQPRL